VIATLTTSDLLGAVFFDGFIDTNMDWIN